MRALIVDDEELLQLLMRESLERVGWTVVTAGDAAEALRQAADPFDVALVDLHLDGGGTGGAALCQRLTGAGVPVLLVSGAPDDDAVRAAGACEVLAKPFMPGQLVAAVERVLGTGRSG